MTWTTLRTLTAVGVEASTPKDLTLFVAPKDLPSWAPDGNRVRHLEIAFDDLVFVGSPSALSLGVWRLSDERIDKVASVTIAALGAPLASIVEVHGTAFFVSVDGFAGGASGATVSGTVRMRPVRR